MKAAILEKYGPADSIEIRDMPTPVPAENELLIKVRASGVSRAHTMMRAGTPYLARFAVGYPRPKRKILGTGFSGIVIEKGKNVTKFEINDEVFGDTALEFSANAEFLTISEDGLVLKKPHNLSHAEASTWGDGALTAYSFLFSVIKLQPKDTILINGASGAIGTCAVQFASAIGAKVTAVCSEKNFKLVKSLGAQQVIDYKSTDITSTDQKFAYIFDTIGNIPFSKAAKILSHQGVYLSPKLSLSLLWHMIKSKIFSGKKALFSATGMKAAAVNRKIMSEMIDMVTKHDIHQVVDSTYNLEDIPKLHKFIEEGHKKGNIALTI
ncbi:MAG: NAD(P)-dependent alcohol dehydrogenase [Leptospiraceae bacterium]|nr:NAD(P)-dependent alcohol dehydrogenase [Leptospiraceae bacterium]